MVIIRPKNRDIELKWLYLYLNSLFTKYFLKKTESGTTVSILTFRDLENLPIVVCSKEKQEEMIDFYDKKNEQVVALQSKLQEEKDELESQLGEMLGSDKVFLKKTKKLIVYFLI